jgi:hypothetical protein
MMNKFQVNSLLALIFNLLEDNGIEWAKNSKGKVESVANVYTGMDELGNLFFLDFSKEGEVYLSLEQPTLDNRVEYQVFHHDYEEKVKNLLNVA